jgi:hypothetical protein
MTDAPEKPPLSEHLAAQGAQMRGRLLAFVYIAIALGMAGIAYYLHIAMGHRLMSPQVLFPSLGAVWFAFRAFYKFTGRG